MKRILITLGIILVAAFSMTAANPYLPLWEHIPDGEPYVFEDPDHPGKYRVYIYGSHDSFRTMYCGPEQVVWSAPIEYLNNWRYDGVIFESKTNARGNLLNEGGKGDVLFAPDIAEVKESDGTKTYYLYPNTQNGGRQTMVAKSKRPDGPFKVCNWNIEKPNETVGILHFDPAVFVDDDGRAYAYWGFGESWGAELDTKTMATLKTGGQRIENLVPGFKQDDTFRFFEASSMRKIKDKYVFIYSRWTRDGEFGLPGSNYTLAYAYSNYPLGPFTYGGTLIDGRGREKDANGNTIPSANPTGNTHGSICEINGQWFVFYHRQTGINEYSRQAMVAPINVKVTEGLDGKVVISEGEYTSEGFETNGLSVGRRYPAAIACWLTGPSATTRNQNGNSVFTGSYLEATYINGIPKGNVYDLRWNCNPVVNNTDGSIVGYKYFNLDGIKKSSIQLLLRMKSLGPQGQIKVMIDSPWEGRGGQCIGQLNFNGKTAQETKDVAITLKGIYGKTGKHAIYLVFSSPSKHQSLCTLYNLCLQNK